jgi:5-methyltetrahydrofolate--homocysteine methyltransferase
LVEAFAEYLHEKVRTSDWGYAVNESLSKTELLKEQYSGIRPAPGYPACPDHEVKADMFRVLQADKINMTLTESLAMNPASSISGFYFAHPQSRYFNVGKSAW